jgi:diguanylate cyclase (GGDEF)-like protein
LELEITSVEAVLWALPVAAASVAGWLFWRQQRTTRRLQRSLDHAHSQLDAATGQDALTGLPTRAVFEEALERAATQAEAQGRPLAVIFLGLDGFKAINEAAGYPAGDEVLNEMARRLARVAGSGQGALARVGGDEFLVRVDGDAPAARKVAARLVEAVAQPLQVAGRTVQLTASAGIACFPEHGARSRLIVHAASAMRTVKLAGGGGHADYDPAAAADARAQFELAADLRQALERGELTLYYQPKVDAASLEVTAAEALLRWQHPARGMVSPAVFIPVAERHGLIGAIGDWVVQEATRQAGAWRDLGLRMRVAINVSASQLHREDFCERLGAALQRHRLVPQRFTCEITETLAMEDTEATRRAFEQLGALGVHVSIDDFGTGHSSLATLRRLPAAELKIDRAFVTDIETSAEAATIAKVIIDMARTLGLRVVAEGVETAGQRDRLVALGCNELQGYLFARPMSATALQLWAMDEGDSAREERTGFRDSLFQPTGTAPLD